jgi:hypothetical protein
MTSFSATGGQAEDVISALTCNIYSQNFQIYPKALKLNSCYYIKVNERQRIIIKNILDS